MPAERINYTDTLRIGTDKINDAIDAANLAESVSASADTKAQQAIDTANLADSKADSTQTQLDTIVINGDSSVEAAQARVDATGTTTYTTLKERLDSEYQGITADLADMFLYVANYGVSHLKTAAENTPIFKQALLDAESQKRPVMLPYCPLDAYIDIDDVLATNLDGMHIQGFGKNTRIRQTNFPKGIFDMYGKGVTVKDLCGFGVPFDATGMGSSHVENSVITLRDDESKAENIYGDQISTVVRVPNKVDATKNVGSSVFNIESGNNVVFNLLIANTQDFKYDKVTGGYSNLAETPPHLIYVDDAFGTNLNLQGGDSYAKGGRGSFAYLFKGCIGGNAGNLYAEDCEGSVQLLDCHSFHADTVASKDDAWTSSQGNGSLSIGGITSTTKCSIGKAYIMLANLCKGFHTTSTCEEFTIDELIIEITNEIVDNDATHMVDIRGKNNEIKNPTILNKGTQTLSSSIALQYGEGNTIVNPVTEGNKRGIVATSTNVGVNTILNYDTAKQTRHLNKLAVEYPTIVREGLLLAERHNIVVHEDVLSTFDGSQHKYTTSGHLWNIPAGKILTDVEKGYVYTAAALSNGVVAGVDTLTTNVIFTGKLLYNDWDTVALKIIDYSNYLGIRMNHSDQRVYFISRVAGVVTNIEFVSLPIVIGLEYEIKVILKGNKVYTLVNGVQVMENTISSELMTTFGSSTQYGIWGRNAAGGKWSELKWKAI